MKTVVLSCKTLEDEVNAALQATGREYAVEWVESGLHNVPAKLNLRLQEVLDSIEAERVLLAMGYCGNAVNGLKTGSFELILPKVDDCISLLLGSVERRMEVARDHAAYFFTEGWLRGERNILVEYEYSVKKYGQDTADMIMGMMYSHYRTLAVLDCGITPVEPVCEQVKPLAELLDMQPKVIPASTGYIEDLLRGPWDDESRFLCIPPHTEITQDMLSLSCPASSLQ